MSLNSQQHDILTLFNLESDNVEDISFANEGSNAIIRISLRANYPPCPDCGNKHVLIKGYETKKINHGILTDRKCILYYKARRYRCPVCRRTFYEHNPFTFSSMKISALTVMNVLRDLKNQSETFTSVAQRYHIYQSSFLISPAVFVSTPASSTSIHVFRGFSACSIGVLQFISK